MPICAVCDTRYYPAGYGGPGEPCDCGQEWAEDYVESDDDAHEVRALRYQWRERLCAEREE